jgi:hypothetical protein
MRCSSNVKTIKLKTIKNKNKYINTLTVANSLSLKMN